MPNRLAIALAVATLLAGCDSSSDKIAPEIQASDSSDQSAQPNQPKKEEFWVIKSIYQGMSYDELESFAKEEKIKISHPFSKNSPSLKIDGVVYRFAFCNNRLVWASWLTKSNEMFIRSMHEWIEKSGFEVSETTTSSDYFDRYDDTSNSLRIVLKNPDKSYAYLVEYILFDQNGQIILKDISYDGPESCKQDSGK